MLHKEFDVPKLLEPRDPAPHVSEMVPEDGRAGRPVPRVSVLIPTFRRPHLLPKAIASILDQEGCLPGDVEIIVIDNCPDASARLIFERAAAASDRMALRYIHDPRPGISHPRNTGLAAARGQFVLFLDDDQQASPALIAAYLQAYAQTAAPILVGPVEAELESLDAPPEAYMQAYFSRRYGVANLSDISTDIARLGTNNAFFERHICFPEADPFEPALGLVGGEDTLLFQSLQQRGLCFTWVAAALAREFVPAQRQTAGYVRLRRFRSGQIRVLTCLRQHPPRPLAALFWMGVGAVQMAAYGLLTAIFYLLRHPRRHETLSRVYGGAGKCFWMERFRFPAYGATARIGR